MSLLLEYIKAVVSEAISRPERAQQHFKLNEFKSLQTLQDIHKYAKRHLQFLGQGSSRVVFRLSGTKVLKVAKDEGLGVEQNRAELDVYTDPQTKRITAKVYDADTNFKWLISEIVNPFNTDEAFESATGISAEIFQDAILDRKLPDEEFTEDEEQFLHAVLKLSSVNDLDPADLVSITHWGLTASGDVVVLDYGFRQNMSHFFAQMG